MPYLRNFNLLSQQVQMMLLGENHGVIEEKHVSCGGEMFWKRSYLTQE